MRKKIERKKRDFTLKKENIFSDEKAYTPGGLSIVHHDSPDDDIPEILKDEYSLDSFSDEEDIISTMPNYLRDIINDVEHKRFSVHNKPPDLHWRLVKKNEDGKNVGIASKGEFVMIYGPPKSRKSTILSCIISSAFEDDDNVNLGFGLELGQKEEIIYFDTEMPSTAFHRRQMKLNHMCGFKGKENIPGYYAYPLKGYTWEEKRQIIGSTIKKYKNILLIIIDQMADLVNNINDRDNVNGLVSLIESWSSESGAIIIGTIHVKRESDQMTGVLGSELSKKMDTGFYLEKLRSNRVTKVIHLLSREEDVEDFKFQHDDEGYPKLVKEKDVDW